ncbi:TraB/GumN family protein [Rhizobium oryzicola]|uniref:TraB/GumN family protein n=1 Tax=Rhizobium oryzicola TaxID=1232668 RepID=UPI003F531A5E
MMTRALHHTPLRRVSDLALWALASLHLLVLVSFLIILGFVSKAKAEDAGACGGRNILADMKQQDPAAYAAVETEAAKVPNGKGLFWKIEKPGIAPSWLLGTMHVTDPRVIAMPKGAPEAFARSEVTIVESDEILDEKKASAALLAKPSLTMMSDGKTIQSVLSKDDADKLSAALKKRGIPLSAVSRMQPWMLSSFVALSPCELSRKGKGEPFLDQKLAKDTVAAGKPVKGLETMEEQLSAMASIPLDFHMKSLMEMISLGDKMADVTATMTDLYLSGDIGMTMPMLKSVAPDGTEGEGYAEFEERIVTQRNKVMAERALPVIEQGNAFMAVGALHLPGKDGLVELFRAKGFTVTPAF